MIRFSKRRLEDTFRTGQKTGFRNLFRLWLNWTGAGICRPCRMAKKASNPALENKQAVETIQDVPRSESGSTTPEKPGNIDLYLLLKKRSGKALSDKPSEDSSEKAVQE